MFRPTGFGNPAIRCTLLLSILLGQGCSYSLCRCPEAWGKAPSILRGKATRLTHPILDYDVSTQRSELRPFRNKVDSLIQQSISTGAVSRVSFYFRDLNNGLIVSINGDKTFVPASLLKVPLMMSYLKQAESDPGLLSRTVRYDAPAPGPAPNTEPPESIALGRTYTIDELLRHMISYSDNRSSNFLMAMADTRALHETFTELGLGPPGAQPEYALSVQDYARFLRILFNASYLNRAMSEKALSYLTGCAYVDGLVAGLPAHTLIAHKFGNRFDLPGADKTQLHECGIVYYPGRPFLLCVMTQGRDFSRMQRFLKGVSALVYDEVSRQDQRR